MAALEILLNTPHIQDLIFKSEVNNLKDAIARSTDFGMQTFDQHLFDLYTAGIISYEDAMRNADSMNNLRLRIKLAEEGEKVVESRLDDFSDIDIEI